jgi:hypothetical protein
MVLRNFKKSNNRSENLSFFKGFEITGTGGSPTLKCEKGNRRFLETQISAQHW